MLYAVGPRVGSLLEPVADERFRRLFTNLLYGSIVDMSSNLGAVTYEPQ